MNKRIIILQAAMLAAAFFLSVNPARAATASAVSNIGTVDTRVADIAVECPVGSNLTDGGASINCGTAYVGSPAGSVTFTVRNTGTAALTLTNPVGKEGANASDFALSNIATSVAAGGSTTFTVTFTPTAAGARTAALHIASNDADENPFDISLSGTGISPLIAPVITWVNPASITYGTALSATQLKATANVSGQLVYSPALGAKLPAGNQTLNVTFTPTDAAHYATAQKSVTLTVNKAAATVNLAGLSQPYNGQPRVVTATTVPAGLNVSITYNGSPTVPVNPGSYAVLAAVVNDNATGSKSGTLAVAKGTQSITFPPPPALRFGDADYALTATASSGLTVSYASSAPTVATIVGGNMLHITGAGKVTITATQVGNSNWNPATAVAKALTIGKRSQTIAFAAFLGHTVGEPDCSPGATATSGLTVTYASASPAVASIVAGKVHLVGKGTVVITASQAGATSWDVAVPVKQTLTVAGKPQTITFPLLPDKGYGTVDFTPGATASSALAITYVSSNPLVATILSGKIHITGVGTTTITAKQAGNILWAVADNATQTLTVIKGTPAITWANPAAISYGTALTATQLNTKASVPGIFLYSPALGVKLPVGPQTLNVTFTPTDSTRYITAQKSVTLTVNKATATVTLAGLSQTYNGQPRVVTATTIPAGLNVNITYIGSPDAPTNCGSYAVVATVDDPNASGTKAGTLTIGKGNQTISFVSLPAMHVGDADRSLTATAASGLPVGYASSTPTVVTIVDGKLHVVGTGTAFITATQGGNSNWNAALPVKQLLTVPTEEQDIRALYTTMKSLIEKHDEAGFLALFAPEYLHQGQDLTAQLGAAGSGMLDTLKTFTFTITGITITGSDAMVAGSATLTMNNGAPTQSWTEPETTGDSFGLGWLRKTSAGWRVLGDQKRASVHLTTGHENNPSEDHYFIDVRVASSSAIDSVTFSGPGVPETALDADPNFGSFTATVDSLPNPLPPVGTEYTFHIHFSDGTEQTLHDTVKSWVPVGPHVTVTPTAGGATIKWTNVSASVPNASYYRVQVSGEGVYWESDDLPLTRTTAVFNENGQAQGTLQSGQVYAAVVFIFNKSEDYASQGMSFTQP